MLDEESGGFLLFCFWRHMVESWGICSLREGDKEEGRDQQDREECRMQEHFDTTLLEM
jgi:hypothetical protein